MTFTQNRQTIQSKSIGMFVSSIIVHTTRTHLPYLTKKCSLFISEAEAGQRRAIIFTISEACRSRGIDPQSYLREVLTRLPTLTSIQIKGNIPRSLGQDSESRLPAQSGLVIKNQMASSVRWHLAHR